MLGIGLLGIGSKATIIATMAFSVVTLIQDEEAATSDSGSLELTAEWGPIKESSHKRHERDDLRDVLQPGPHRRTESYPWTAFEALLPDDSVNVGEVFSLDFELVQPFLEQVHPHPRAESHMNWAAYSGVYGVLLERTEDSVDLLLRAHIEFELKPKTIFFTVSQFEGRLVANVKEKSAVGFRLAVPARSYNYDVHIREQNRTLIDIGYVPDLGVRGGALPEDDPDDEELEKARIQLKRAFYPFARLDWMSFAEGLEAAEVENKPLHLVTIFGQLDDESC